MRIDMGNIINALIVIIGSGVWYQMREIRQLFKDLEPVAGPGSAHRGDPRRSPGRTVGVGGYVVGRSAEKVVEKWKGGSR